MLKLIFMGVLFTVIFYSINLQQTWHYLTSISPLYLALAAVLLIISQTISAFRSRFYFSTIQVHFSSRFAIAIYFIGMLFNNILPGGVSGDGYKVYYIKKTHNVPILRCLRLLVSDRANGLFILLFLAGILAYFSHLPSIIPYGYWVISSCLLLLPFCYLLTVFYVLREPPSIALRAAVFSLAIQAIGCLIVFLLIYALGSSFSDTLTIIDYMVLFAVASIVSILPISIGGAGLREATFIYAATFLPIEAEFGVTIALLFFVINLLCSLIGVFFLSRIGIKVDNKELSSMDRECHINNPINS